MRTRVTIGDFSRASHLSIKTLRHYHEAGLLEPSEVDPTNGYRYYSEDQIPAAQVVRRLRDLQMPVAEVRAVLAAVTLQQLRIAQHLAGRGQIAEERTGHCLGKGRRRSHQRPLPS